MKNPGQDPALAAQYGQARASTAANDAGFGTALPSGFDAARQNRLKEQYAQGQDASMLQRQTLGAQLLNPMAAASGASQGNQSIFNSSALQNSFWGNLVGGLVGALKTGGIIPKTGLALVHKGEVVLNKKQQKKHLKGKEEFKKSIPSIYGGTPAAA